LFWEHEDFPHLFALTWRSGTVSFLLLHCVTVAGRQDFSHDTESTLVIGVESRLHQLRTARPRQLSYTFGYGGENREHNTGDIELQRDVVASVEHILSDRPGEWRVLIVGSQGSDRWEMKILGPNAFERS
jgi:hypothetical protein